MFTLGLEVSAATHVDVTTSGLRFLIKGAAVIKHDVCPGKADY